MAEAEPWTSRDRVVGERVAVMLDGPDAATVTDLIRAEGLDTCRPSIEELCQGIEDGSLLVVVLGADLPDPQELERIAESSSRQPVWSDLPFIVLVERQRGENRSNLLDLGQVRLLERPVHPMLFKTTLYAATRSRLYQRRGQVVAELVDRMRAGLGVRHEVWDENLSTQFEHLRTFSARLAGIVEERERAEERLREREALYRYAVEVSHRAVWSATAEGIIFIQNVPPEWKFGEVPEMLTEGPTADLLHADDVERVNKAWWDAVASGEPYHVEYRIANPEQAGRTFVSHAEAVRDEQGKVLRWYGYTEDITEQKAATSALAEAEERYRLAARATNDAIWDWNVETGDIDWSDAAAAYFGPGSSSLPNSRWEQAIHPDDRDRVLRSINSALTTDKARWSAAYRMQKADGDYAYVYDRGFIIRNADGKAVRAVGAIVDLTERRRAEAELRRTQAELIHVSRVSAMGTMASTLAHELNQPLTAVTSYVRGSRRLLSGLDQPGVAQVCEALEFAEAAALRAGQIVRRLRELVARGAVAVGPEDLSRLIEDACVVAFVDEHLHGISHRVAIDRDARWVEVDRIQIQQVLINLIRNAVQALQHAEHREVTITAKKHDDELIVISVADCGTGIPESVRDALFSPFHTTKSGGMGIGLSISRTIVEAHHGKIWAEDNDCGGATFRFTVPAAEVPIEAMIELPEDDSARVVV